MHICPSATITPRRVYVRQDAPDRYTVIRLGGRRRMGTGELGIRALRLFADGLSLSDAERRLQSNGRAVHLDDFVRGLLRAGLVKAVGGQRLPDPDRPSLRSWIHFGARFYGAPRLRSIAHALPAFARRAPFDLACAIEWRRPLKERARRALANARQFPGVAAATRAPRAFVRGYSDNLLANFVDFQLLTSLAPPAAERWLARHIRYDGFEHLQEAVGRGRGVILAAFHFGSTKLIPLALMQRGISPVQIALPDYTLMRSQFEAWAAEFAAHRASFRYEAISGFAVADFRRILDELHANRVLVWLPDIFDTLKRTNEESEPDAQALTDARARHFRLRHTTAPLPQSRIAVDFLGRTIWLNAWVGAFADMAGAAIVPAALLREGGTLTLVLRPPIYPAECPGPASACTASLNERLFRALETFVAAHPTDWFGWHHVHMAGRGAAPAG